MIESEAIKRFFTRTWLLTSTVFVGLTPYHYGEVGQEININYYITCPKDLTGLSLSPVLIFRSVEVPEDLTVAIIIEGIDTEFSRGFPVMDGAGLFPAGSSRRRLPPLVLDNAQRYVLGLAEVVSVNVSDRKIEPGRFLHVEEFLTPDCKRVADS